MFLQAPWMPYKMLKFTRPVHGLHASGDNRAPVTALDVANAIYFLASDDARMINGVCLPVDRAWGVI
jgi:NAD(P)-dependent dehydrogenase (short-subunit alcohol dehydrogenase family)